MHASTRTLRAFACMAMASVAAGSNSTALRGAASRVNASSAAVTSVPYARNAGKVNEQIPKIVGEGEECEGSLAPEYAVICKVGLQCTVPVNAGLGAPGVCQNVSATNVTGTANTTTAMDAEQKVLVAQADIEEAVTLSRDLGNMSVSASWWDHHGAQGETCCMCSVHVGHTTILYSAEDYHHWYGSHNAMWKCMHDCRWKCESDYHHGRYFGCYDERHLQQMDRQYGHKSAYSIQYGHFGSIC
jgi:hypothetical protein